VIIGIFFKFSSDYWTVNWNRMRQIFDYERSQFGISDDGDLKQGQEMGLACVTITRPALIGCN
jgi:hypothetical protein